MIDMQLHVLWKASLVLLCVFYRSQSLEASIVAAHLPDETNY